LKSSPALWAAHL